MGFFLRSVAQGIYKGMKDTDGGQSALVERESDVSTVEKSPPASAELSEEKSADSTNNEDPYQQAFREEQALAIQNHFGSREVSGSELASFLKEQQDLIAFAALHKVWINNELARRSQRMGGVRDVGELRKEIIQDLHTRLTSGGRRS